MDTKEASKKERQARERSKVIRNAYRAVERIIEGTGKPSHLVERLTIGAERGGYGFVVSYSDGTPALAGKLAWGHDGTLSASLETQYDNGDAYLADVDPGDEA